MEIRFKEANQELTEMELVKESIASSYTKSCRAVLKAVEKDDSLPSSTQSWAAWRQDHGTR